MPHDHGHSHAHSHAGHSHAGHSHADPAMLGDRKVSFAIAINILLTVVQIAAGIVSGSLSLIADAIHNLSDALTMVIAFWARKIARRPADESMTFGYGRAEVVAALVNYTALIVIAVMLAFEGFQRFFEPQVIEGWVVVIVAGVALVIDLGTAWLVMSMSRDSMNMRAAFLHNVADAMSSVAVILAGVMILVFDLPWIDPLVTIGISGYILWHAGGEIGPVIRMAMLGSPDSPTVHEVADEIETLDGVASVHHLHLWRMQEHEVALEAHVVLAEGAGEEVRGRLKARLEERFGIAHTTIELESHETACHGAPLIGH